jgi:hypothetical protein
MQIIIYLDILLILAIKNAVLVQARSYGGARWGSAPPESGNCPPLEKLGHNYYILSKTYFLSIQKLNE